MPAVTPKPVRTSSTLEHLGIDDVRDDGLIFARQVFRSTAPRDARGKFRWIFVQAFDSSFRLKDKLYVRALCARR